MHRLNCSYIAVICGLLLAASFASAAPDYVWVEGEQPTSANVKWTNASSSHPDWLSGGHWLQVTMDEGKIEKELPAEGALLDYTLAVPAEGKYQLWVRLGFEFARSAFAWKLDDGQWSTVTHDTLTTDLMEMDFFSEAAWLKLADAPVRKGDHHLTIRIAKTKNKLGKYEHVLFGIDAICLSAKPFYPHSRFKPDEEYRTAKDEAAAKNVFRLPFTTTPDERCSVELSGLWEVCRNDEQLPGEVAEPIKDFPEHPYWSAVEVPGDRNTLRPDLLFAHRLWYRTRVNIAKEIQGRSFFLVFPQNNLNTTVYVNGVFCGFDKNPLARVQIDVTKAIKRPGVNEIWVGIKDAWYGRSRDPADPMKLRKTFNLPESFFHSGFQELAYPIWSQSQSGIIQTPTLVAAGSVYASDVFVKPSVAKKQLAVEVTIRNDTGHDTKGEVAIWPMGPQPEMIGTVMKPEPYTLAAGEQKTVEITRDFAEGQLWWPDSPKLYRLRTTVTADGAPVDISDTPFGFREWSIDGIHFKLNGVPFHGWCDQHAQSDSGSWLAFQRKTHQQMMRFWGTTWQGMSPDNALNFFDKNGVVVRRSGILDGEAIGYHADEPDPNLRKISSDPKIKMDLIRNWRDQVVAQVKGERNHPSVMIWSIENEWLFINCINLYGSLMDNFEREETLTSQAVQKVDPTRPTMSDGGAACKAQTLPVCGNHYITGAMPEYPALAYDANVKGGGRGRWEWDQKRPRFAGEDWFIAGNHPELSYIGGEAALTGKAASLPAAGLMTRILQEGYRWADYGGWDFWMNNTDADESQYIGFSPRAVLCREWNFTFGSAEQAKRTVTIFNDTRFDDPITFTWTLKFSGENAPAEQRNQHVYQVTPGGRETLEVVCPMPVAKRRIEGEWILSLTVKGEEVFKDTKGISVLPAPGTAPRRAAIQGSKGTDLIVFDPEGSLESFLKLSNIGFLSIHDLKTIPESGKILLVGKDAVDKASRTSTQFAAWAAAGRTVIVLEQKEPLEYQAIPAEIQSATNAGRTAFVEDEDHPAHSGLRSKDFFTWGQDEIVYRDAYAKPTRGAKSLIECGELLRNSALIEVPVEKGLMLLCQLPVEEKLSTNAVARTLLDNLLNYGAGYKLTFRPATVTAAPDSRLFKVADAIGLTYGKSADPLEAIGEPSEKIAIVQATPANLAKLADHLDKVSAFTGAGGWIVFNDLTPEGLASYNKIVGFDHMIRPFKRERVTFPPARNPLTAGIPAGDVTMYTSKRIFPFAEGNYTVSDEFSYVVDYDEIAPFGESTFFAYSNIVSGFTNADGWVFIINYPIPADGSPSDVPIKFPKPQTFTEFTWTGNTNYWPQTKVNLIFDGDRKTMASFDTVPNGEAQTFAVSPPRQATQVTLEIAGWRETPNKKPLIGIDNIKLKVSRPPDFYKNVRPMLNVGAMMEYPRGKGGIVLCNLLFKDSEEVPVNMLKKRSIFSTLLRNLKAPFSGGRSVIVGTPIAYAPIDISKQANQYRTDKGWFGDKKFTFADLPTGRQSFGGVPFDIFEFATSPVPTAIMLGGNGVPNNCPKEVSGIAIHRKADALFFLQAARIDHRRTPRDLKEGEKWEMAKYVIHYSDGQTAEAPILSEIDVENYRQQEPKSLPGAQIAWAHPYEGTPFFAVAYIKQWNNPRPDAEIASVDLTYGADRAGVPVLLAITAGSAK
ncbi:MAG TPA: glycoside hydrolase family 2 TIM barrel-domain containing protein [Tepidisphaeraceae bacterium]|jgi:beta-galactosidase|nr:glycoside hydrolase family 2 TIM barrel-domain containing protein [Tepidisphaeraceae bacterium]